LFLEEARDCFCNLFFLAEKKFFKKSEKGNSAPLRVKSVHDQVAIK